MRLSWRAYIAIWFLFAVVVYFPLVQLAQDNFVFGGGLLDEASRLPSFSEILLTSSQWRLLATSLLLATGTAIIAVLVGVPYAFLCEKTDLPGHAVFSVIYLLPLLIPPYMHAIVWSHLLAHNGPVNLFLMDLFGLPSAPLDVHTLEGAMFVLALAYFPFVTLLTLSGLKSLDRGYEEAALLQQGRRRTITKVTLPMIWPQITAGALFVLVFSLIDFGVPDILRVRVYPVEIFIQFSALYNERAAIALGAPLLAVTMFVIALQTRTMRGRSYVNLAEGYGGMLLYPLASLRWPAGLFCLSVVGFAVLVPLQGLIGMADSWETFRKAISSSAGQIGASFLLAVAAAAAMTLFSLLLAFAIQNAKGAWRAVLEYSTQIPFAIPPIVLGIGLIRAWNKPATDWLYGTSLIVILGYIAHYIPFTVRVVYSSVQQMNPRLVEAGWLARNSGFSVIRRITLPLLSNGMLTAFVIAFVLAIGELSVTMLVVPPGTITIPITIYNFMHYGAEATVAALCLILLGLQFIFAVTLFWFGRWLRASC